jgi:transcriptional regulator with XRE-family HTH domain
LLQDSRSSGGGAHGERFDPAIEFGSTNANQPRARSKHREFAVLNPELEKAARAADLFGGLIERHETAGGIVFWHLGTWFAGGNTIVCGTCIQVRACTRTRFNTQRCAMPKRPRFIHPIRAAREALAGAEGRSISQKQFGKRLGVSGSYIQRIELGQVPPPNDLCSAIALLTGVDPESLKRKRGRPMTSKLIAGQSFPASAVSIAEWKQFHDSTAHDALGLFALKHAELALVALGFAAMANRKCQDQVLMSFASWLGNTAKEFGLEKTFLREMKGRADDWNEAMRRTGNLLFVQTEPTNQFIGAASGVIQGVGQMLAQKGESTMISLSALRAAFNLGSAPG